MTDRAVQINERDLEVLRQRWDEGKASGCAGPLDIKRLIAEARSKPAATKAKAEKQSS